MLLVPFNNVKYKKCNKEHNITLCMLARIVWLN